MIELFLWLLLICRVCWKLVPYILGLAGAAVMVRYISPGIPAKYVAVLFVTASIGLISGLKDTLSD
jgi:hypothetical protein